MSKQRRIINIPLEYLDPFQADASKAWQSFGNFAQHSDAPYFENVAAISESIKSYPNPFIDNSYTFESWWQCEDDFYRFMHIDLAQTGDACGVSMWHIPFWVDIKVTKWDEAARAYTIREKRPVYKCDFLARIEAPANGEIIFSDVRELVYETSERGFPLLLITYDGFQSVDSLQILRSRGFIVDRLSIDRTSTFPRINVKKPNKVERISTGGGQGSTLAAWSTYKEALNQGRILLPTYKPVTDTIIESYGEEIKNVDDFGHTLEETKVITWIEREMMEAMLDETGKKVIEPPKGSIDLLESCAGSVFNASNNVFAEEIDETPQEKRRRLARQSGNETLYDQEDFVGGLDETIEGKDSGFDSSAWDEDNFD